MSLGLTLPLTLQTPQGNLLGALLMNDKAFQKSLEQKELWAVHPQSQKVLPVDGVKFLDLQDRGSFYQGVLDPSAGAQFSSWLAQQNFQDPGYQQQLTQGSGAGGQGTLERLAQVIKQRRIDKPEGSYTTHLFAKGLDKIRKKTGEEAIELVLAQTPEDTIYESADLIYHLLVLLEVQDLQIQQVLAELENRMK